MWPQTPEDLVAVQRQLGVLTPEPWRPAAQPSSVGACFVCFPRGYEGPGAPGDRGWAAAVVMRGGRIVAEAVHTGAAPAAYQAGYLALREGPLLEDAVRALAERPDVLLVDATGRDHPRRAGLALHLGARLELPTIGVTDRPLVAEGTWPPDEPGAIAPLRIGEELVGYWVRTLKGARPVAVHAGWRTEPAVAAAVVLSVCGSSRTPDPLRHARRAARSARANAQG